jgi:PhnB protein
MQNRNHGVPEGYHSITPYLSAPSADALIAFFEAAFDARLIQRMPREEGGVAHAEVEIGDSKLMLCDATDQHPAMPASFYLYVPDADASYRRALDAGARSIMEPTDMPYGDRHGGVTDPAGNQWWIAMPLATSAAETS